jgi:hypothetical protein
MCTSYRRLIVALTLTVALVGCHHDDTPPVTGQSSIPRVAEKSGYVRRANNDTVIVFVHGVFGGPRSTWTNEGTHAYWPELLTHDDTYRDTDIYVLGYDSPYLSTSYSLDDLSENARLRLNNDEIFSKHKNVIFVCHSMGGLVIRGLIKRYQFLAPQVPLIYFLSTPTSGAHIARLASLLSKNPQLGAMMPANADTFVTVLQHDWRALPVHPLSRCAFETKDTFGVRVVDEQSAGALCDGPLDPINEDHIGVAKPADSDATSYIALRQAYLDRTGKGSATPSVPASSNPQVTGHVDTLRRVDVSCGEVKESLAQVAPPLSLKPEQKIVDAVVSLQETSNLKHGEAVGHGVQDQKASIYYRIEGLDKASSGSCPGNGLGVIVVAFIVSQPRSLPLPPGFQTITADDQSIAILSRPGTVQISDLAGIQPIDAGGQGVFPGRWVVVSGWSKKDAIPKYTFALEKKKDGGNI